LGALTSISKAASLESPGFRKLVVGFWFLMFPIRRTISGHEMVWMSAWQGIDQQSVES
jgi:hypothetical protein